MLTLQVHEKEIEITTSEEFVRGTVGKTCQIDLDEFWADYSNTIVFKRCGGKPINILIDKLANTVTIPFEVMAESGTFRIGVFGVAEDKVLPTLWSDEIKVRYGTDTYGTEPAEYTPDEIEQLKATKQDKLTAGDNITIDENNVISANVDLDGKQDYFADVIPAGDNVELDLKDIDGNTVGQLVIYKDGGISITGLTTPTQKDFAANKGYVDTKLDKKQDEITTDTDLIVKSLFTIKELGIGNSIFSFNDNDNTIAVTNDRGYSIILSGIENGTADNDAVNVKQLNSAIATQVSSVYKAKGSIPTISDLPTPSKDTEGFVYNIESEFTTNLNFVEGVGKTYPAGTNVVIVNTEGTTYKYDVLAGMVDLTNYATKTDLNNYYTKSQTYTKTEVDNKISTEIGNINSILATMFNDVSTQSDEETTDEGAIE